MAPLSTLTHKVAVFCCKFFRLRGISSLTGIVIAYLFPFAASFGRKVVVNRVNYSSLRATRDGTIFAGVLLFLGQQKSLNPNLSTKNALLESEKAVFFWK
jgi:hypothetical protein